MARSQLPLSVIPLSEDNCLLHPKYMPSDESCLGFYPQGDKTQAAPQKLEKSPAVIKEKGMEFTAFFLCAALFGSALKADICYLRLLHNLDVLITSGTDLLSCYSSHNTVKTCTHLPRAWIGAGWFIFCLPWGSSFISVCWNNSSSWFHGVLRGDSEPRGLGFPMKEMLLFRSLILSLRL